MRPFQGSGEGFRCDPLVEQLLECPDRVWLWFAEIRRNAAREEF